MTSKPIEISEAKEGKYIVVDGVACVVKSVQRSKPGKHGHAKCRIEATGLIDGQKRIFVKPAHDTIESPLIEKKTAQVLSIKDDLANVMDMETFETFDLKIPEELRGQVKENTQILYWIILNDRIMKQIKASDKG